MNWEKSIIQIEAKQPKIYFPLWHKFTCVFILFSLLLVPTKAQTTLQFQNFTQKDGLSSNYVLCIIQDHQDFIWIGTENGLTRFDGQHFLSFRFDPEDEETISDNWVWTILEDRQDQLWIGTQSGLNRLNRNIGKIERIPLIKDGEAINAAIINNIFEGTSGGLWVIALNQGLFRLELNQEEQKWQATHFAYEEPSAEDSTDTRPFIIVHATAEELWVAHSEGIDCVHISSQKTSRYLYNDPGLSITKEFDKYSGLYDGKGKIFLGVQNKLFVLDISQEKPVMQTTKTFGTGSNQAETQIGNLFFDRPEVLFLSSNLNLAFYNLKSKKLDLIQKEGQIAEHLFPYGTHAAYKDRQGNYWIGTPGDGLYLGQKVKNAFTLYQHNSNNPFSISNGPVRTFLEEENKGIWVGIIDHGLDYLVPKENNLLEKSKSITANNEELNPLSSNRVIKIIKGDQESIWIATNDKGLIKTDASGKPLETFIYQPNDPNSLSANRIWGLAKDRNGYIWIGTWQDGLDRLNPNTGQVKKFKHDPMNPNSLGNDNIRSIFIDKQEILWIGTEGGLVRFNPNTEQFARFQHDYDDPNSLSDNLVWAIYEDKKGAIWVGTNTGLNRYSPSTRQFERFYEKDGLPDNGIYGILEDDEGLLWVSTKNGLARQLKDSPGTFFRSLGLEDGLKTTSFLPKAYLNSAYSDQLYFGSSEGMLVVSPTLLQQDSAQAQLALHDIKRSKRKAVSDTIVTNFFINGRNQKVNLGYQDQFVTFTISDLTWMKHPTYKYEYQLVGFNKRWTPLEENMRISFSNLPPGKYTLRARAKTLENKGLEACDLLELSVFPPWWESWWAYLGYVTLTLGIIFFLIQSYLKRQLEIKEAENLRTLDSFKNKLFTNITHEFRTPLTIISGMTEQIKNKPDRWQEEGYHLILKNTNNLLDLINQILELQKLESGELKVKLQQGDIIPFLQNIFDQFRAYGQSKRQSMDFISQVNELNMDYDPEKTLRIVSNLLANAIKYAPEQGKIAFLIEAGTKNNSSVDQYLVLTVKDNGPGIPKDQLPFIFNRFFQGSNDNLTSQTGTGIGLSLTHELVSLLGGEIEVDSVEGQGTCFQVYLPVTTKAKLQMITNSLDIKGTVFGKTGQIKRAIRKSGDGLPLVLIIEDNPDITQYLQICLEGEYRMEVASDGQIGIDLALELIPDIIISDVMMPKKDGFEVCEKLKEDIRTSHIPIILLTAKSDVESRIVGLKQGADDYLGKPFHEAELLVRMQNLLKIRRQLQERYQQLYTTPLQKQKNALPSKEDEFILKLKEVVEARMGDLDFNLNELSQLLFLSRSQLGRKVKALTGRSLAIYIRSIRLQKARQLLQTTNLPVKEIGYEVGFSNPVYFSQSYSDEFGESPTNTRYFK